MRGKELSDKKRGGLFLDFFFLFLYFGIREGHTSAICGTKTC